MKNSIIILAFLLMACNTRKKNLDISKSELNKESAVKSTSVAVLVDSGIIKTNINEAFNNEIVEVFKYDTAGKITEYQKISKTKNEKQTNVNEQKAFRSDLRASKDSIGKLSENKFDKRLEVKTSRVSALIIGTFIVLLIAFLAFVYRGFSRR